MNDFPRIEVEYDGYNYISEWDFNGIKRALDMDITEITGNAIEFVKVAFYCSLLKNHPFVKKRNTDEFVDKVIQDEDYGLSAFSEITDAFVEGFIQLQGGKNKNNQRVFTTKKNTVTNIPKPNM